MIDWLVFKVRIFGVLRLGSFLGFIPIPMVVLSPWDYGRNWIDRLLQCLAPCSDVYSLIYCLCQNKRRPILYQILFACFGDIIMIRSMFVPHTYPFWSSQTTKGLLYVGVPICFHKPFFPAMNLGSHLLVWLVENTIRVPLRVVFCLSCHVWSYGSHIKYL